MSALTENLPLHDYAHNWLNVAFGGKGWYNVEFDGNLRKLNPIFVHVAVFAKPLRRINIEKLKPQ